MTSVPIPTGVLTVPAQQDLVASIEDLHVTFRRGGRDIFALRGVSLDVRAGEILGLVGESGSGKSVLGLSLLGLHPDKTRIQGRAVVRGTDMVTASPAHRREVRHVHLGAVFQDPMTSLNPTMRIGRQVAEAAGSGEEAERLLAAVGIPDPARRMTSYPHELSGGLRQRVMIAMAVAGKPALVIADEPTTALDVTVQAQVLALLKSLRDEIGCSVLMITHDLGVAAQVADRVAVLYAGRLAELGRTDVVLSQAAHPYTLGLMRSRLSLTSPRDRPLLALAGDVPSPAAPEPGCAFAPRCALAGPDCTVSPPPAYDLGEGHLSACILDKTEVVARLSAAARQVVQLAETADRRIELDPALVGVAPAIAAESSTAAASQPPIVSVQRVTKSFSIGSGLRAKTQLQALRGINLDIAPGESVALVGESGSGKSTLLRVVAGLEQATGGDVTINSPSSPQMVFQDAGASLTPWMTVEELIGERLRGIRSGERNTRVAEALSQVGLPVEVARARAGQLSGGQRQRVCLARATVIPPSILLCDEPTSALDVSLAAQVINLIARLRSSLGMSVLFVTHDLSVARIVADRIAVMYLGRIVEIGDADQVTANPVHPYTRALMSAVPDAGRQPPPLKGEPASPLHPPTGCAFHPRCPQALPACSQSELDVRLVSYGGLRQVACINPNGD